MGVPKLPKLKLLRLWGPITLRANLRLRWGLKQSCIPRQQLSNSVLHAIFTQGNWVDSRLLVVRSQSANLTPDLSFGHNLCFKCPNGSCEHILDIYVSITFQWYKDFFESIGFWPLQSFFKHPEVHRNSNSQGGSSLGVWGFISSHFLSLSGFLSWPTTLQAPALVTNPRLGLHIGKLPNQTSHLFSTLFHYVFCFHIFSFP
jgi:hypothetical protein